MYDPDGWPQVYCHVRAKYIGCASSCPDHVHPKVAYLYGPNLEGTYGRYVSDDGSEWTTIQCAEARVGQLPGTPVPDMYMVDLNDSLFTRGYMIEYYFSANDSAGRTSYHPEDAPTRADYTLSSEGTVYRGISYIFEMTCLPLGCSGILYVDDFHGLAKTWQEEGIDFQAEITVNYADGTLPDPIQDVSYATFIKRFSVTVTSPYLDYTVSLNHIFTYY